MRKKNAIKEKKNESNHGLLNHMWWITVLTTKQVAHFYTVYNPKRIEADKLKENMRMQNEEDYKTSKYETKFSQLNSESAKHKTKKTSIKYLSSDQLACFDLRVYTPPKQKRGCNPCLNNSTE